MKNLNSLKNRWKHAYTGDELLAILHETSPSWLLLVEIASAMIETLASTNMDFNDVERRNLKVLCMYIKKLALYSDTGYAEAIKITANEIRELANLSTPTQELLWSVIEVADQIVYCSKQITDQIKNNQLAANREMANLADDLMERMTTQTLCMLLKKHVSNDWRIDPRWAATIILEHVSLSKVKAAAKQHNKFHIFMRRAKRDIMFYWTWIGANLPFFWYP